MKKGCFVKTIIFLTILTAVILYLAKYKFNEFIFNPGKRLVVGQINREFKKIKDSPEKESLKVQLDNYIMGIKSLDSLNNKKLNTFVDSLKIALEDSAISKKEYRSLSHILKDKVK